MEHEEEWKYIKGCKCMKCYDHEEITLGPGGMGLDRL